MTIVRFNRPQCKEKRKPYCSCHNYSHLGPHFRHILWTFLAFWITLKWKSDKLKWLWLNCWRKPRKKYSYIVKHISNFLKPEIIYFLNELRKIKEIGKNFIRRFRNEAPGDFWTKGSVGERGWLLTVQWLVTSVRLEVLNRGTTTITWRTT